MIISSSCIGMESARTYTSVRMDAYSENVKGVTSFLNTLKGSEGKLNNDLQNQDKTKESEEEQTEADKLSKELEEIRNRFDEFKIKNPLTVKNERDAIQKVRAMCLQYLLQLLFGGNKKCDKEAWDDFSYGDQSNLTTFSGGITTVTKEFTGIHYRSESEETEFSTTGSVITADGRELEFNLSFTMSREFGEYYENKTEITYAMCDPLVINLDTDIASVSDVKIHFDLDSDGEEEEISTLASGSAFLAYDKNEDGIINDGNELFGTQSGNGFKDLAAYDLDGNGWIDEADEIFDKLKIFTVSEDGTRNLVSIKDKGIGAIYLGNVSTDFSLNNDSDNKRNAMVRATGVFLYENGAAGTIQHVDMVKEYSA